MGRWRRTHGGLCVARGDVESATRVMPRTTEDAASGDQHPDEGEVLRELQIAALLGDRCLGVARSHLVLVDGCDSPLVAASAARIGFQALAIAPSPPDARSARLRNQATRQLQTARGHLTDEWQGSYHGVQLALAEGYAARVAGQSGTEQFREAARLAGPFGDFFALEPRLDLAQELLAHGLRDEGRELLVECWTTARDMGAGGLQRRASGSPRVPGCHFPSRRPPKGRRAGSHPANGRYSSSWRRGRPTRRSLASSSIGRRPSVCTSQTSWPTLRCREPWGGRCHGRTLVQPNHDEASTVDPSA